MRETVVAILNRLYIDYQGVPPVDHPKYTSLYNLFDYSPTVQKITDTIYMEGVKKVKAFPEELSSGELDFLNVLEDGLSNSDLVDVISRSIELQPLTKEKIIYASNMMMELSFIERVVGPLNSYGIAVKGYEFNLDSYKTFDVMLNEVNKNHIRVKHVITEMVRKLNDPVNELLFWYRINCLIMGDPNRGLPIYCWLRKVLNQPADFLVEHYNEEQTYYYDSHPWLSKILNILESIDISAATLFYKFQKRWIYYID